MSEIGLQNLLLIGGIVAGALVVFCLIRKIVKLVVSLVIVIALAAAGIFFCVRAGYISRETAEKINPLNSEKVRQAVRDAGVWAGDKAKDAARKALSAAVDEAIDRAVPTNRPSR